MSTLMMAMNGLRRKLVDNNREILVEGEKKGRTEG